MSNETLAHVISIAAFILFLVIYGGLILGYSFFRLVRGIIRDYKLAKSLKEKR